MRFERLMIFILLILFVSGCASVSVKTDFDPAFDFSSLKTYRWATEDELNPDDVLAKDPLIQKRLAKSVDSVMAGKGFRKVDSGDADMVIVMHAGAKERMRVHQTGMGGPGFYGGPMYGGWYDPWWGAYGGMTSVSYYTEGTLVIDIVPWETKELAWRGMGTKTVRDYKSIEEQQEAFDKVVAEIMASFPPK